MVRHRTLVSIPPEVVEEIDKLVGSGKRSAFLTELARRELRRRRQQHALRDAAGCWKDQDHPELAQGSSALVSRTRDEDEERFRELAKRQDC